MTRLPRITVQMVDLDTGLTLDFTLDQTKMLREDAWKQRGLIAMTRSNLRSYETLYEKVIETDSADVVREARIEEKRKVATE